MAGYAQGQKPNSRSRLYERKGSAFARSRKTAGFPGPFRKALFLVKSFPFFFALLFRTVEAEGFPYALKGRPMGTPRWASRLIRLFCYGSAFAEKLRPRSWSPYRKTRRLCGAAVDFERLPQIALADIADLDFPQRLPAHLCGRKSISTSP